MTKCDISKLILSCAVSSSLVLSTVMPGAAAFAEGAFKDEPAAQEDAALLVASAESEAEAEPEAEAEGEPVVEVAAETEGETGTEVEGEVEGSSETEGAGESEGATETEGATDESVDPATSEESSTDPADPAESSDPDADSDPDAASDSDATAALPASEALSFVYVDQDTRADECMVNVAFFLSNGKEVSEAALDMTVDEASEVQAYASAVSGSAVAFQIDASQIQGSFVTFTQLTVAFADGTSQTVDLTAEQDAGMGYGFYAAAGMSAGNSAATASLSDDGSGTESELSFYTIDGDSLVEAASLSDAIATAEAGTSTATLVAAESSNIVIALDAGHDSTLHPGAASQGYKEAELTLKIAQYCKAELETYPGVTVYMVRDSGECPYPDASSESEELGLRVQGAVEAGACVYVSIHLNSYSSAAVSGAEVWYPNSSLNTVVQDVAKDLSQDILDQLVKLGLVDRGTKENYTLASGDDYYNVIRTSKHNGIPGIIVEHAFISSTTDAAYFSTDEALQKLGVADATGIANYFGLSKDGSTQATVTQGGVIEASQADGASGVFEVVASNVHCTNGVSSVAVALECQGNDEAGIRWYQLSSRGDGTWAATVSISDFGVESGTFSVQGYLCDADWTSREFCKTTLEVEAGASSAAVRSTWDDATQSLVVTGSGGSVPYATNVAFAVTGAQGDTVWYQASRDTDGSWSAVVPRSAHGSGSATVSLWATVAGSTSCIASKTVTFPAVATLNADLSVGSYNPADGTFEVRADNVSCPTGVAAVAVGVWAEGSTEAQARWYALESEGNGSWSVSIPLSDFGGAEGTYTVRGALSDSSWKGVTLGTATGVVEVSDISINTDWDEATSSMVVTAKNGKIPVATNVALEVTGSEGGTVWYQATRSGKTWSASIPRSAHGVGAATVSVWATVGGTTYKLRSVTVTFPEAVVLNADLSVGAYDASNGTFEVRADNVTCPTGVAAVAVGVWAEDSTEAQARWYALTSEGDGSWSVKIPLSDFGGAEGTYTVRGALSDSSWKGIMLDTATGVVEVSDVALTATWDDATMSMVVTAKNGRIPAATNVAFAVTGSQGSTVWYQASRDTDGSWSAVVPRTAHGSGSATVSVWATVSGSTSSLASTKVTFPEAAALHADLSVGSYSPATATFEVRADSVTCPTGVAAVAVGVWAEGTSQDDARWYALTSEGDGSWSVDVPLADFGNFTGVYHVVGALSDSSWKGIMLGIVSGTVKISDVSITNEWDEASASMKLNARYGDIPDASNVAFAVTGTEGGTVWYQATRNTDGSWSASAPLSAHGSGTASVSVYAKVGDTTSRLATTTVTFPDDGPITEGTVSVYLSDDSASFKVVGSGGSFPRATSVYYHLVDADGGSYWYSGEKQVDGSWMALVPVESLADGACIVAASGDFDGETESLGTAEFTAALHAIMNASPTVTVAQMVAHFKANGGTYPEVYASKGAATIEDFCTILVEEATAEGVDPVVVFSQAMVETGYLSFGRKVAAEQCNFCGLGAGAADSHGLTFASVREGLRAQVQHLKAYGSTEDLVNTCIDERFDLVSRGCAPYVESLGGRWATSSTYGFNLSKIIDSIL